MGLVDEKVFIDKVWQAGGRLYRDLPWRGINDPYAVWDITVVLLRLSAVRSNVQRNTTGSFRTQEKSL